MKNRLSAKPSRKTYLWSRTERLKVLLCWLLDAFMSLLNQLTVQRKLRMMPEPLVIGWLR